MDDADHSPPANDDSASRRLLHRWFIEHNPLYLVSAALVLVGVILLSRGLTGGGSAAQMGITAIAEVYAWALIGGAALLVRIRLRRPAVMLALLAALYQCDLTLHTETCAFLGVTGLLGTLGWSLSFVAKLRALAWAMQLTLSRSALVVASCGAVTLALLPWVVRGLGEDAASPVLGAWLFVLFATGLWTSRRVISRVTPTPWAATVARRSIRATWIGWAGMMLIHAGFWLSEHRGLDASVLVPAAILLGTRAAKRESTTWLVVSGTLLYIGAARPSLLWLTAAMAAVVLVLRALRQPVSQARVEPASATARADVYRVDPSPAPPVSPPPSAELHFIVAAPQARRRLLLGAAGCGYLAVWTCGWTGGPWPEHRWWLDLVVVAATLLVVVYTRRHALLGLPGLLLTHWVVSLRLVSGPQSALQWGIACIGVGFGLLALCLIVSVRWRQRMTALALGGEAIECDLGSRVDRPPPRPPEGLTTATYPVAPGRSAADR